MHKPKITKLLIALAMIFSLGACGGGGGGGSEIPTGSAKSISGGGVKGPLANAIVSVYAFDANQAGFKGALAASATTNNAAAITGLALPFPVSPPYILEFTSDAGTTDITTGLAPVITTMRTVITQSLLDGGEQIYATPLTTMAVDIAITNSNSSTTATQFETALATAATQVVSTVGFGMSADIDIFDTPPLVDSTTDTTLEQTNVAAYRSAVEALTAIIFEMEQQSSADVDQVLAELSLDLADGDIDGMLDGVASSVFSDTTLDLLAQEPGTLVIPNTAQTVADVQAILVAETATTGSTTSTTQLGAGGSITTTAAAAESNPDTDGDGTLNVNDAFPRDANEITDSDGDGIGDVADPDDDNNGILDEDEGVTQTPTVSDGDGDGFNDGADNCPVNFNPAQRNTDGQADGGDACDLDDDDDGTPDTQDKFPLNGLENRDVDGDGIGDNADSDDDNDGFDDTIEDGSGTSADHDNDGKPNREDRDSDNDGVFDNKDYAPYNNAITFNRAPVTNNSSVSITEDSVNAATTLDVSDDGVAVGALSYSISSGPANGSLSGTAPNLTYSPNADFNGKDSFSFRATDAAGRVSNLSTLSITITAVDDSPLVTAGGPFSVTENAALNTAVATVSATDIDSTVSGFSIVGGNNGGAFAIASNGALSVANPLALDYESATSFLLSVIATDGNSNSDPVNFTIDVLNVNDAVPILSPAGPLNIFEDALDTTAVGTVSASDADSSAFTYSISAGNIGSAFTIDNSGAISVADSSALDRETLVSYTLSIVANDGANDSAALDVVINLDDVNDTAPVVAATQSFGISEDAVNSAGVGSVSASDADTSGSVTGFNITAGNTGSAFAIDANGAITVNNAGAIDYESATSFILAVTATDGSNTSAAENITIDVIDVNDTAPVVAAAQSFAVDEDAPNTTTLGTVSASDVDTVGSITSFNITGGNTASAFAIDSGGVISVNDSSAIDFESATSFTLAITASDGSNTSAVQNVTVNINDTNDNAPVIDVSQSFSLDEDAADATVVGIVTASDLDTVGTISAFTITGGNSGSAFAIDLSGQITVNDSSQIDAELSTSFTLVVTASDGTNTSDPVNVGISVNDINDTAPVITAAGPFAIDENSANSTAVTTLSASDADTVGSITGFTITAGNSGGAFAISNGGAITVANGNALDRETSASFTLSVTATDGTNTSASVDIVINLNDLNDNAPVITAAQSFGVNSAASNSTVVGSVVASDADTSAITAFNITGGNTGTAFAIANDGEITLLDNTNLLANSPYSLSISASDGVNTSSAETITINVTTGGAVWDSFNWDDGSTWQ